MRNRGSRRCLMLAGGYNHPFAPAAEVLTGLIEAEGVECTVEWDPDRAFSALDEGHYDLWVVYALHWRMLADKYEPDRAACAFHTTSDHHARARRHLQRGGSLIALHTACICFDDWPEWGEILGARWLWGQSWHPPLGRVAAYATGRPGPFDPPESISVTDEVYCDLEQRCAIKPLMEARPQPDLPPQPIVWARHHDHARVVVDTLGHDAASIGDRDHAYLLRNAVRWACHLDMPDRAVAQ